MHTTCMVKIVNDTSGVTHQELNVHLQNKVIMLEGWEWTINGYEMHYI